MPTQKGGGLFDGGIFGDDYTTYTTETGVNSGVIQYVYYFILLTIIILLVLVLVNYLIYPVFKTTPGGTGFIPVPGSDDSLLFWKTQQDIQSIRDTNTRLGSITANWSYLLDIQVDNPTANTNTPRILFVRGPRLTPFTGIYTDRDTILTIAPSFNTIAYLDRMTNDLNIAVQTSSGTLETARTTIESITIPNIPVGKSIRLGVMLGSRVLEVYVNGFLVRSKAFTNPVKAVVGEIQPPSDAILSSTARVRNLRIIARPLIPAEFRAYGSATDLNLKNIPDSCSA
jgi:hypothetical protein